MTPLPQLKKQLTLLGLTDSQANIYLTLVEKGELRIQAIADHTNLPRSSVYEALKGLFDLGLVEELVDETHKKIAASPITSLRHSLLEQIDTNEKRLVQLERLEGELDRPLQRLSSMAVRYYKDVPGARQLMWNTLKAKTPTCVYSEWGRGTYVGMKFYERFVSESKRRDIEERVLINPSKHALKSIRTYTGTPISRTKIDTIRTLPESSIHIRGETFIYDHIYAQVYLKNAEINGFEVESKHFVDTQRSIFETLWQQAKPVAELL